MEKVGPNTCLKLDFFCCGNLILGATKGGIPTGIKKKRNRKHGWCGVTDYAL